MADPEPKAKISPRTETPAGTGDGVVKPETTANVVKTENIETGRHHVFVLSPGLVQLRFEWPVHLVDRLPDDFTLTLSGPQISKQERTKSEPREDNLVWFEFEWKGKTKAVQL